MMGDEFFESSVGTEEKPENERSAVPMRRNNSGQGMTEYGLVIGLIAVLFLATGHRGVSDGSCIGIVTNCSRSGWWEWTKTYEGDLLLGGSGTVTTNHLSFTVGDKSIYEQIHCAVDKKEMVELGYHEYLAVAPWNGDTRIFITSVKPIQK